ncbi:hypothetical protein ACR3K2_01740 [Cryptosporidium serpentis]
MRLTNYRSGNEKKLSPEKSVGTKEKNLLKSNDGTSYTLKSNSDNQENLTCCDELCTETRKLICSFFQSIRIFEAIPDNSRILGLSANVPLAVAVCFLLEDQKEVILIYDEENQATLGSFSCNDVLLFFYLVYLHVDGKKENNKHYSLHSLEEVSGQTIKQWMSKLMAFNYSEALSGDFVTVDVCATLLDGLHACVESSKSRRTLNVAKKCFNLRNIGCWGVQSNSCGKHNACPVCYISPYLLLSLIIQNLHICSEFCSEHLEALNCSKPKDILNNNEKISYGCNVKSEESLITKLFHKQLIADLSIGQKGKNIIVLKEHEPLYSAIDILLTKDVTHIPIVDEKTEEYTGVVVTAEKCFAIILKAIINQDKIDMKSPLKVFFSISLNGNMRIHQSNTNRLYAELGSKERGLENHCTIPLCPNCTKYPARFLNPESPPYIVDTCLSDAIIKILLSEDQCVVLVSEETLEVTTIVTAYEICDFLIRAS